VTPIEKALEIASTVQGADRALEHMTTAQVRVYTADDLTADAQRNIDGADSDLVVQYVTSVLTLAARAHSRGDGVAVYENHDLGHPELGERKYVTFGGEKAQLETRHVAARTLASLPAKAASIGKFVYGDDVLPKLLPDIGGCINWRYQLVAIAPAVV